MMDSSPPQKDSIMEKQSPNRWRRYTIAGLAATIFAGAGAAAFAHGGPGGWHGSRGWNDNADPATMQKRTEGMTRMMLADINATPEQEQRIAGIMTATMTELRPLREKHMEARKQVMDLLSQPTIDRQALEAIRAQEIAAADQVSRRITQSIADAAEVLNPEQRAKLAERMRSRMASRGGPRG
jgi:Spy/CpxP family protein refolding chaperone